MRSVYLDNNATTFIAPEVAQAMANAYAEQFANPASQHAAGRRARRALEAARCRIAEILGAKIDGVDADRVVFTSGGTESNNLALRGLRNRGVTTAARRWLVSAIEHPSISETAAYLAGVGWNIQFVGVDELGVVKLSEMEELLRTPTHGVSVMLANHETGVLQPVEQIARMAAAGQAVSHCDATQAAGKLQINFCKLGVDALTVTAHKFHGPRGIGVLLLKSHVEIDPLLIGGSQQLGVRPGTESVALAVGMQTALELWERIAERGAAHMRSLRDRLERGLCLAIPELVVHGAGTERLPQTLNVSFPGVDRQAMLVALDRVGVACATGSACTSGSSEPSPVLLAMGSPTAAVESSLRFSLSRYTETDEIDTAIQRIVDIFRRISAANAL